MVGKRKANDTKFKEGDVILFLRDVKKEVISASKFYHYEKRVVIPKNVPVTISQINNSHVWVRYKEEVHWLRNIPNRMIPATDAAKVLYGVSDV